ncbi:hypothetical protein MBRA1_001175 [Malassezia brasiliensis]|uniref:Trafficking protein particle complex subunit 11 domain-containing protein n=1 Tax=Malassezia brasiliensis TaxID=1821822 RepID=A0AAF0DRA1_9BASI|nr:hypothetical protein MBRA1_001175 [Malassezia brasiliensis]
MNAYPAELVVHLHPLVLVTGITRDKEGAPRTAKAYALPTPLDTFPEVCAALAEALVQRGRTRVWSPPSGTPHIHFVLNGYAYVYPPAKTRASTRIASDVGRRAVASLPPRSPLSPLQVGGPLFPDGILAPAWIRKHSEYVPSTHVVFYTLPAATLADDAALIEAIGETRAMDAPRGIRTVAVLMGDRAALARADTDARIAHLRRASRLEQRGSLLVLPTDAADINAFVRHLERALYDGAVEYYRERARHVRRNRARYPPPPSIAQPILAAASAAGVLRPGPVAILAPEGWTVRTAAKLGAFAEMQGDLAEALAQYSEAYHHLVHACLSNTKLLAPRTKRWAEAKVLADTLALKLVKLHLYRRAAPAAMLQYMRHTRRIAELSTGWGIGTSTYEFWSWLAKQYQLLGDLLQYALHPSDPARALVLPPSAPEDTPTYAAAAAFLTLPGTHYYHAALCTHERAVRFHGVQNTAELPNYAAEAKVDHVSLTVELFTEAYDAYRSVHHTRHAHLAAARIALTFVAAQQYKEALPYLERALRWYRRDAWQAPRFLLAANAAQCAHAIGDDRAAVVYVVELLQPVPKEAQQVQQECLDALGWLLEPSKGAEVQTATPMGSRESDHGDASVAQAGGVHELPDKDAAPIDTPHDGAATQDAPAAIAMELGCAAFAHVSSAFVRSHASDTDETPFQLVLTPASPLHLHLVSLRIFLEGRVAPLVSVRFAGNAPHTVDVGTVAPDATAETIISCSARMVVITGALRAPPGEYKFANALCTIDTRVAQVDAALPVTEASYWLVATRGTFQRIALPSSADRRQVVVEAPAPIVSLGAPDGLLAGETVAVEIEIGAPLVRGVLVLPPDMVEAGASVQTKAPGSDDAGAGADRTMVPQGKSTVYLRAPQAQGTLYTRLYGVASDAPDAPPVTHTDAPIAVSAAFSARVSTQWTPSAVPRTGRLMAEVTYLGTGPILVDRASVDVEDAECVRVSEALGAAHTETWQTNDRAVWAYALTETTGTPGSLARLVLAWHRPETPEIISTTQLGLPSLAPPPPPPVQVQLRAPGRAAVNEPMTMHVFVANTSTVPLDLLVEVDQTEAFFLAGWRRHQVAMLLPGEQRTLPILLVARAVGLHMLPKIRAFEVAPEREPVSLGVPPSGVVQVV